MTDEQINIAIAEACGWTKCPFDTISFYVPMQGYKAVASNICNDLNAMHEAVLSLTDDQLATFDQQLDAVMDKTPRRSSTINWYTHRLTATARQWAEAFLRTIEKGRDE
jgi:hypothetical protein